MHPALRFILSLCSALACGVVTGIGTAVGYAVTIPHWTTSRDEWLAMLMIPMVAGVGFAVGAIAAGKFVYERLGR